MVVRAVPPLYCSPLLREMVSLPSPGNTLHVGDTADGWIVCGQDRRLQEGGQWKRLRDVKYAGMRPGNGNHYASGCEFTGTVWDSTKVA